MNSTYSNWGLLLFLGVTFSAAGTAACGAPGQSTYASCLREPKSYGEGATRNGHVTSYRIEQEYYLYSAPEEAFRTTITRSDCKDSLRVKGPGIEFSGGPWLPLWDEGFAANYNTKRLAFAYYAEEHKAYVWVDGKAWGPYHDIMVSPRFSDNGEHVAFVVKEGDGTFTLIADGRRVPNHPMVTSWPFLYVLDDGRLAAPSRRSDQKVEVIVGNYRSPPFDELCGDRGFSPGPKGHYGLTGKVGSSWVTIIDGAEVKTRSLPSHCEIKFSEDGSRSGYLGMAIEKDPASKQGVVIDGVYHPELERASDFAFYGSLPVATKDERRQGGDTVRTLVVVGTRTPEQPPTEDVPPAAGAPPQTWIRVRIGDSVGPRLDEVDLKSLKMDDDGRVRYTGRRRGTSFELVDNVVQEAPKPASVAR